MVNGSRFIRAILLDVHGGLFERKTKDPRLIPEEGRKYWARCFEKAVAQVLGVKLKIDPKQLIETKYEVELRTPKEKNGRVISERNYFLMVNQRILEILLPQVLAKVTPRVKKQLAQTIRSLHRQDHLNHVLYDDMREFLGWARKVGFKIYLQTAQEEERVKMLLEQNQCPETFFDGIFTTARIGYSKLRLEFWQMVLKKIENCLPSEVVVIGNNAIQDSYCSMAGIPAMILDRDKFQEKFLTKRGNKLRGVKFLRRGDSIPPKAPFIIFEARPLDFKWWLETINSLGNKNSWREG
jgi:FMN phosphatase YigB (HAD superfamily)